MTDPQRMIEKSWRRVASPPKFKELKRSSMTMAGRVGTEQKRCKRVASCDGAKAQRTPGKGWEEGAKQLGRVMTELKLKEHLGRVGTEQNNEGGL